MRRELFCSIRANPLIVFLTYIILEPQIRIY